MAKALKVEAQPREVGGSSQSRRLRRAGSLPGIVYGEGKVGMLIQVDAHTFSKALKHHEGEHILMDLDIAGKGTKKVLLQDIQHNHLTGKIIHVDFHEISMTKKLRVEVPLRLVGEPVGVTQMGGVLEYLVRSIEIECLPTDIPEHIDADVSALTIAQRLSVGDIKLDAKYTILTNKDLPIAAVTAPREEEVAATPEAAVPGAAEPEVLREKKVEGEEGAAEGKDAKGAAAKDDKGAPTKESKGKAPAAKEAAKPAAGGGKEAKK
jgi:large subunit ribosomal protein L25